MQDHLDMLVKALQCQLDPQCTPSERQDAQRWIDQAMSGPGAWNALLMLLQSSQGPEIHTPAAVLARQKLSRDISSMSLDAQQALAGQLLSAFTSATDSRVAAQLGLCLGKLLPSTAAGASDVVLQALQDASLVQRPLRQVQLLQLLAEEASHLPDSDHHHLESCARRNAAGVVQRLGALLSQQQIPPAEGLRCFAAWAPHLSPGAAFAGDSPFSAEVLAHLHGGADPCLRDACHATATTLAGMAQGCPEGVPLLGRLAAALLGEVAEARDEAWVRTAAAVGAAAAPHLVAMAAGGPPSVAEGPALLQAVLEVVQRAAQGGDPSLAEHTFPMWHAIRLAAVGIDEGSKRAVRDTLRPTLWALCDSLCGLYALPAGDPAAWRDAAAHRSDACDEVLCDVAWILTASEYLRRFAAKLEQQPPGGDWAANECLLHAMSCLKSMPGPALWGEAAPSLLGLASRLQAAPAQGGEAAGRRLLATYVALLPRLSEHLNEHPEDLRRALEMCCQVLGDCEGAGAQALLRICAACKVAAAEAPGALGVLQQAFAASQALPLEVQSAVAEGVGRVIWGLPAAQLQGLVGALAGPAIQRCSEALAGGQGGRAAEAAAALACRLAALRALLQTASQWCRDVILDTRDLSQPVGVAGAWMHVSEALLALLSSCIAAGVSEGVTEQAFGCLGAFTVLTGEGSEQHSGAICSLLVTAAEACPLPCVLGAVSEVALTYSHLPEKADSLLDTVARVSSATCGALTSAAPAFSDVSLAKALFGMWHSVMEPSVVYAGARRRSALSPKVVSSLGKDTISTASHALTSDVVVDPATLQAVLKMLQVMMRVPAVKEHLAQGSGAVLLWGVVHCIAFKTSDCVAPCAKLLASLKRQPGFAEWLGAALAQHQSITDSEKREFSETLTGDGPGETAAKAASNRLHRTVHTRTSL